MRPPGPLSFSPGTPPELKIDGVAVGASPTDITAALDGLNGSIQEFLIPSALLGLVSQFPDAKTSLLNALNKDGPFNRTGFLAASYRETCSTISLLLRIRTRTTISSTGSRHLIFHIFLKW